MDDEVWAPTVFSKNRDRLLNQEVARLFFAKGKEQAAPLISDEHFTVDGTLIEAWASQKSFRPKDNDNEPGQEDGTNFHGEQRLNDTHESSTDPAARLYKKSTGKEAKLAYLGHIVTENRQGLIAAAMTTTADSTAETETAILLLNELYQGQRRITVGADKAYDNQSFVTVLSALQITPHVAQNNKHHRSAIDGRTTRHEGYHQSSRKRWVSRRRLGGSSRLVRCAR
jgi:hypothetical protein